jgi:[CysO sulfur-carrier protein]-S-L-cysteine hydrolase
VLTISREILDAIIAHARRDHPEEACGIVAGPEDSDEPVRVIPMTNADRSETFYRFDPTEHVQVYGEMFKRDERHVVIYHSHTHTEPYPSRTDIEIAGYPDSHYLLVSTRDAERDEFRSFRIVDKQVTEEPVRVVDGDAVTTYMFGQTPATVDYECPA